MVDLTFNGREPKKGDVIVITRNTDVKHDTTTLIFGGYNSDAGYIYTSNYDYYWLDDTKDVVQNLGPQWPTARVISIGYHNDTSLTCIRVATDKYVAYDEDGNVALTLRPKYSEFPYMEYDYEVIAE